MIRFFASNWIFDRNFSIDLSELALRSLLNFSKSFEKIKENTAFANHAMAAMQTVDNVRFVQSIINPNYWFCLSFGCDIPFLYITSSEFVVDVSIKFNSLIGTFTNLCYLIEFFYFCLFTASAYFFFFAPWASFYFSVDLLLMNEA